MLLTERKTIPREAGWHYEIKYKYDGYRLRRTTGHKERLPIHCGRSIIACFGSLIVQRHVSPHRAMRIVCLCHSSTAECLGEYP